MPQAAVAAIGAYLAGAIAAAGVAWYVEVFLYVATSYLLSRASAALTPRQRSPGLGAADPAHLYIPHGVRIIEGRAYE